MTETYFARFQEYEEYDIEQDCRRVRFLATTSTGTWHGAVPVTTARSRREQREAFKTYVLQSMALNLLPHEVEIG